MSKRLYTGFSFFEFIWTLCLRLACVFGLIYFLTQYDENPGVISIVAGVCCLLILIIGDDQIVVTSDKITQTTNSFLSLIFKSGKTYEIEEIKSAYLKIPAESSPVEVGLAALLSVMFSKRIINRDKAKPIYFDLKNGQTVKFDTNLEDSKMNRIVELVNSLVSKNSH